MIQLDDKQLIILEKNEELVKEIELRAGDRKSFTDLIQEFATKNLLTVPVVALCYLMTLVSGFESEVKLFISLYRERRKVNGVFNLLTLPYFEQYFTILDLDTLNFSPLRKGVIEAVSCKEMLSIAGVLRNKNGGESDPLYYFLQIISLIKDQDAWDKIIFSVDVIDD